MFADHGVVHVRDVAAGLVRLLDTIDGVLLPARPPERRRVRRGARRRARLPPRHRHGRHDAGRPAHRTPLFAAHAAFGPDVDPLVEHLLAPGHRSATAWTRSRATAPVRGPARDRRPRDAQPERRAQQVGGPRGRSRRSGGAPPAAAACGLHRPRRPPGRPAAAQRGRDAVADPRRGQRGCRTSDPSRAFAWLAASTGPHAELADDVIDAVRRPARRRRAPPARDGPPHVGRLRAVHGRADRPGGLHAAARDRRCRVRDHLRRRPRRRRGQHQGRVRDARRATSGSRSTAAASRARRPPTSGGERRRRRSLDIAADVIPSFGGPSLGGGLPAADAARSTTCRSSSSGPTTGRPSPTTSPALVAERDPSLARRLVVGRGRRGRGARGAAAFYCGRAGRRATGSMPTRSCDGWPSYGVGHRRARPRGRVRRGLPGDDPAGRGARRARVRRRPSSTSRRGPGWSSGRTAATRRRRSTRGCRSGRPASSAGPNATPRSSPSARST